MHILDTWGSEFRKCTICTSVKSQVILLFFYQILKVSDHLRLISLPDVYLRINYDFHSFNSQILVLLLHRINIQGVLETIEHSYDQHWIEIFWRPHRSWFKVIWILQYKLLIVLFEIIYGPTRQLFNIQMAELLYPHPHTDCSHGQSGSPPLSNVPYCVKNTSAGRGTHRDTDYWWHRIGGIGSIKSGQSPWGINKKPFCHACRQSN